MPSSRRILARLLVVCLLIAGTLGGLLGLVLLVSTVSGTDFAHRTLLGGLGLLLLLLSGFAIASVIEYLESSRHGERD